MTEPVSRAKLSQAQEAYRARWGREWPFDLDYLEELYIESKHLLGLKGNSKLRPTDVMEETLVAMRETHDFDPTSAEGSPCPYPNT